MPSSTPLNFAQKRPNHFSKHNLLWLVFTVLVFSILVKLGFWQNSRAAEKERRLAQIEKLSAQKPISLSQLLTLTANGGSLNIVNDFPVYIKGAFDKHHVFLLDNQVNKGRLGYRVYQMVDTGEYAVLVSLGWVQGSVNRQEIPKISSLSGQYEFKGHIRLIEVGIQLAEQVFTQTSWPLRVQQIELDKFSVLLERELLPFVVYLDESEKIGFEKNWQPIVMPPEKHRAYAFQWFSLAIAWLLLRLWAKFSVSQGDNKNTNKAK